jgi:hypothetical protein
MVSGRWRSRPTGPAYFRAALTTLQNGGVVLFGTDVGFTSLYDTSVEFELGRLRGNEHDELRVGLRNV